MPSASVSTATAVKPGFFNSWRKANLRSFMTQCLHGIDFGCSTRRNETRQDCHRNKKYRNADKRHRIKRAQAEQHFGERVCNCKRAPQPECHTSHDWSESLSENQREHVNAFSTECHPHANFARPLTNAKGDHAVDSNRGKQQRHETKSARNQRSEAGGRDPGLDVVFPEAYGNADLRIE